MGVWEFIGIYIIVSGLILTYFILEAPIHGKDGSIIEESKLTKFKKLWKTKKK